MWRGFLTSPAKGVVFSKVSQYFRALLYESKFYRTYADGSFVAYAVSLGFH